MAGAGLGGFCPTDGNMGGGRGPNIPGGYRIPGGKKKGGGGGQPIPGGGGIPIIGGRGGGGRKGGVGKSPPGLDKLKKSLGGGGNAPGNPGTGSSLTLGSAVSSPLLAWARPHLILRRLPPSMTLLKLCSTAASAAGRLVYWMKAHCCLLRMVTLRISPN